MNKNLTPHELAWNLKVMNWLATFFQGMDWIFLLPVTIILGIVAAIVGIPIYLARGIWRYRKMVRKAILIFWMIVLSYMIARPMFARSDMPSEIDANNPPYPFNQVKPKH